MIQCNKCGQGNSLESNFCRFCGNRLVRPPQQPLIPQPARQKDFDLTPPRPYSWKSDEFNLEETKARKTGRINRVQPFANTAPTENRQITRPDLTANAPVPQHQQANMGFGYRCPRCATQLLPRIVRKISPAGWVLFAVLLVTFFPLFWIGFLIKEEIRVCPVCNLRVS